LNDVANGFFGERQFDRIHGIGKPGVGSEVFVGGSDVNEELAVLSSNYVNGGGWIQNGVLNRHR